VADVLKQAESLADNHGLDTIEHHVRFRGLNDNVGNS
jgi:hypothetical protein